jgi:hypothetical protein
MGGHAVLIEIARRQDLRAAEPTRIERKRLPNILVLPIIRYEDGYGLTSTPVDIAADDLPNGSIKITLAGLAGDVINLRDSFYGVAAGEGGDDQINIGGACMSCTPALNDTLVFFEPLHEDVTTTIIELRIIAAPSEPGALRELSEPQYRLRIGELRVFYDVTESEVQVLAIVTKIQAQAWLEQEGVADEGGGVGQGEERPLEVLAAGGA